jgi:hypothetical protein
MACAGATVPVPKVAAVPETADSSPFLASNKTLAPVDLAKAGYVEEEFILTGTANVYDWAADGTLKVKTPNAPYGTRILVRRPAKARFSGTVVVEIMNTARRFDWPLMWGYLHDQITEHGDAWVGVTTSGAVQGLKKFNPARYAQLSYANPDPGGACPGAKKGPSDLEDGLRWDILSQVAAALKSDAPDRPLAGMKVQYVFLTASLNGADVVTYINAMHRNATVAGSEPAYNGYLIKNGGPAGRLNQCAAAPPKGDPRQTIANVNVPVMNIVAEGEVLGSLAMRKPDSDDPDGRFRQYEIVGAAHIDRDAFYAMPVFPDQIAATGVAQGTPDWPINAPCDPAIPLGTHPLLKYAMEGALNNLDLWVRKGIPAPKADLIAVKDAGTPQASLATDELGALGGVRNPYVDVPVETYSTGSPGPGTCRELAHVVAFDAAHIQTLYGGHKKYAAKFSQSVDRLVKERFFTESTGKKMKAEMLTTPSVTSASAASH